MKRFIPVRRILKNRHMEQLAFCEACGEHEETIQHALFYCTWVKISGQNLEVWRASTFRYYTQDHERWT